MSLFRWVVGLPAACMITAGLFFIMSEMIKNRIVDYPPPKQTPELKITADIPPPHPGPVKPTRPVVPENAPEPVVPKTTRGERPTHDFDLPEPGSVDTGAGGGGMTVSGPTIKITPTYPEGCRSKGVEGIVVVEFDVTPEGDVTNVRVTSSPDRCFDRPIRNAVAKWKYPPASSNGRPAMRYGVVEVFNFQLVD